MKEKKGNHSRFEWAQLFMSLSIPVAIAVYTVVQNNRDLAIAAENRAQDLGIAENQQQDELIRDYGTKLSKLLERHGMLLENIPAAPLVARFLTLSTLAQLSPNRRAFVVRSLYEAKLITCNSTHDQPVISLQSANLTELNMVDESPQQKLKCLSLDGALLIRACFHQINLVGGNFSGAILSYADFSETSNVWLSEANNFIGPNNSAALDFKHAYLRFASFSDAKYEAASFNYADMQNANLRTFLCQTCWFPLTNMAQVDLRGANIVNSSFSFANLSDATLQRSRFEMGVDFYDANMIRVDATHCYFSQSNFTDANLENATFENAKITNSTLANAKMVRVSMQYSIIIDGTFSNADLSSSNWRHVQCERCIFNRANLTNADLYNATFISSHFRDCIVSERQLRRAALLTNSLLPEGIVIASK